ncbi:unnamed protein product [Prunus armeniaca]
MFLEVQLPWDVLVPAESLGPILQRSIVHHLLDDFAQRKAAKDVGYYVAVTSVDSIGDGRVKQGTGEVEFRVLFSGITFKLFKGEVLLGVVQDVLRYGVFLQCGPAETVFLSNKKMPDYRYVRGDNPMFLNDKLYRLRSKETWWFASLSSVLNGFQKRGNFMLWLVWTLII